MRILSDGDGLRDSLTTGGNTTTFTWDIASKVPQVLDDGSYRYIYGLSRIAEVSGSNTYYYLPDALGSPMALCNSSGTVLNTYNYDVFGGIRSSTGSTANAFTFTGEQTDATTGLEYLRARYYDSSTGRFLRRDPKGGGYAYGSGNPVSRRDPLGLYDICGVDPVWGPICFDSTQVGLPANPPDSCDGETNTCVWNDSGTTAGFNYNPQSEAAARAALGMGPTTADATAGCATACSCTGSGCDAGGGGMTGTVSVGGTGCALVPTPVVPIPACFSGALEFGADGSVRIQGFAGAGGPPGGSGSVLFSASNPSSGLNCPVVEGGGPLPLLGPVGPSFQVGSGPDSVGVQIGSPSGALGCTYTSPDLNPFH